MDSSPKTYSTRQAAVAGLYYPGNSKELSQTISELLSQARDNYKTKLFNLSQTSLTPKALIVPHAGYYYSGQTAADAFITLEDTKHIKRVVLLGQAHKVKLDGIATTSVDFFETPLGKIPQDMEMIRALHQTSPLKWMDEAHWQEHSLEVQLPFLQTLLEDFAIVALAVGDASASQVSKILNKVWGDSETLIVISSDLNHYKDYSQAPYIDRTTCDAIEQLNIKHLNNEHACGSLPIKGLIRTAKDKNLDVHTMSLTHQQHGTSLLNEQASYGSWVFCEN